MKLTTFERVSVMVVTLVNAFNERFIQEAIREWDEAGEGCFSHWIQSRVKQKWGKMARWN